MKRGDRMKIREKLVRDLNKIRILVFVLYMSREICKKRKIMKKSVMSPFEEKSITSLAGITFAKDRKRSSSICFDAVNTSIIQLLKGGSPILTSRGKMSMELRLRKIRNMKIRRLVSWITKYFTLVSLLVMKEIVIIDMISINSQIKKMFIKEIKNRNTINSNNTIMVYLVLLRIQS